ncbi:4133_t:CDS:2 [Funneliformis mosseae]|uniref:4133_t:CDS:1 n=1 Tax=Funneliformis mosseae TaxID=27381 RepID=A0A9N8ZWR6_FUNMO|nr:4133_t:CDS:2 [Funneliformis mosseae]
MRRSKKMLQRINESKATQFFVLTSVCQSIIDTSLETRVYLRNMKELEELEKIKRNSYNCNIDPSKARMTNITEENIIFISFQIFQVWFCFNAIYNQNTIQIITIAAINFCCACLSIVQLLEVKKWYHDFESACSGQKTSERNHLTIDINHLTNDIPLIITLMVFATIISFLSWKLYRQFGWNIYKKIGGDISMQAIESCSVFGRILSVKGQEDKDLPKAFSSVHIGVTAMIIINQILGYRSIRKEMKLGMILVCSFWVVIIIDFCILLRYSIGTVTDSWYFYTVFLSVGITLSLLSLIWSVRVKNNFGKGLQDHIDQEIREPKAGNNPSLKDVKKPPKWVIDD